MLASKFTFIILYISEVSSAKEKYCEDLIGISNHSFQFISL